MAIQFNNIKVNSTNNGSIFIGENSNSKWSSHSKTQTLGNFFTGFQKKNVVLKNTIILNDDDVIDSLIRSEKGFYHGDKSHE